MCGIVGIVSEDAGARSPELVRRMLSTLVHRGPDDEGVIGVAGATLGVRRLAVIDIRGGHQPMTSEDGRIVAVQNGEIYNFEQIREDLVRRGHTFTSFSDTEVLPHAYEEFGVDLVARLHGMFALAVWDDQERILLLARDRFGKKPLFYFQGDGILAFASEIQALLVHPAVGRDVDTDAMRCYFTLGYVPAPLSAFRHIRKVEPAHALSFQQGAVRRERYWRLNFQPKLRLSKEDAVGELDDRISRAVKLRLKSDVPLGAFLSGGLDSSVVVRYMCRLSSNAVQTFSVGFGDADFDELPYARMVARHLGTQHHEFVVGADDVRALPKLIRNVGEPFADSSIVPTYQVARVAKSHVTVVLNGDGGDEIFGGYGHYRSGLIADALSQSVLAGWPASSVAALLARASSVANEPRALRRVRRLIESLPMSPIARYQHWTGPFTQRSREMLPTEAIRGGLVADLHPYGHEASLSGARTGPERYMALDVLLNLPGDLLVKMDIATMANGLEARSPLLDHQLAEFVAALPTDEKVSLTGSKRLLRRLAKSFLPSQILERPKMGFSAPVARWLRGPLREMFQDLVLSPTSASGEYLPMAVSDRLFAQHLRGSDHSRLLWSLLVYEIWNHECVRAAPMTRDAPEAATDFGGASAPTA